MSAALRELLAAITPVDATLFPVAQAQIGRAHV